MWHYWWLLCYFCHRYRSLIVIFLSSSGLQAKRWVSSKCDIIGGTCGVFFITNEHLIFHLQPSSTEKTKQCTSEWKPMSDVHSQTKLMNLQVQLWSKIWFRSQCYVVLFSKTDIRHQILLYAFSTTKHVTNQLNM